MIWKRTSTNVMKAGDWSIIKWPWKTYKPVYALWHKDDFKGRFNTAEEAKEWTKNKANTFFQ